MSQHVTECFFLSPQQKSIWLDQLESRGCAWTQAVLRMDALDEQRLRSALEAAVSRHEILRTVFVRQAGMRVPFQSILERAELGWEVRDAAQAMSSGEGVAIATHRAEQSHRGFDLEHGPLLRALLLRTSGEPSVLILTASALCLDAHSLKHLAVEVMQFYRGEEPSIPEPIRYVQFSQWQNDLLEDAGEDSSTAVAYWSKNTRETAPVTLPIAPEESESAGLNECGVIGRALDATTFEQLEATAARLGASLRACLLAAWQVLLWRMSGQAEMLTHVSFDGREHEELRGILGPVAKLLPIRSELEADFSFRSWVGKAQRALDRAAAWQEYFDPAAHRSAEPSYVYSFLDERGYVEGGLLVVVGGSVGLGGGVSGVGLGCVLGEGGLRLELWYGVGRYGVRGVERLLGHYLVLLGAGLADAEQRIGELPLLSAGEQAELFGLWCGESAAYPCGSVGELVAEQAERTPERVAVRCGESRLSYAELNRQGNRLAHRLRGLGVGAGTVVGLCVERSVGMVVGVLGVLKAGGAYVPLSAEHPRSRLERQLAGVPVLVSERGLLERLPAYGGALVWLEDLGQGEEREDNPETVVGAEDLAYVMYTSGSTGEPKGVEITQGNLLNYSWSVRRLLDLSEEEPLCFAMVSTLTADLGHTCLYPALLSGGTVDVVPYGVATDGERMAEYVAGHGVDVLKIVPSHLESLLGTGGAGVLPRRYLITGGEGLRPSLVSWVEGSGAGCGWINHYGPTETTVGSLVERVERGERWPGATVAIGRPLANTWVYVLDGCGQVCPVGVAGELYIGGLGVSRGYRNRAELTAERFVADRFRGAGRLYRTGDRVRSGADGRIEYLGRMDDQVKVRGYRVEPGEIAGVLERQPEVRQAVVVAREDARGEMVLTGYVVAREGQTVSGDELVGRLRAELPEYMVPQAVVVLARLPLTANGKLDRNALPLPQAVAGESYQPPQTPTQQLIAEIWAEVLKLPRISRHDDFFLLGGHSLLATQVIARVRERFGVEIALRSLFEQPTLSRFAMAVDGVPKTEKPADGPIRRVPRNTYRAEVRQ